MLFKSYLIAIELMSSTKCFHSALDVSLFILIKIFTRVERFFIADIMFT